MPAFLPTLLYVFDESVRISDLLIRTPDPEGLVILQRVQLQTVLGEDH